jgi:MarR family transcriptional regulator for hemolysin
LAIISAEGVGDTRRDASIKLTIIARQLRARFDEMAVDLGVTRSQWRAIAVISRFPGASQRAIAEHLEITEVSAGRLVERLAADGLVERRKHDADKRTLSIFLTAQGEKLTDSLDELARRAETIAWQGFDEAAMVQLNSYLDQLRDNLARPGED